MAVNKDVVLESMKEILRWVVLFILSWIITETLSQASKVPEFFELRVWVFTYFIPLQLLFTSGLTLIGRGIDRLIHESPDIKANGLLPF